MGPVHRTTKLRGSPCNATNRITVAGILITKVFVKILLALHIDTALNTLLQGGSWLKHRCGYYSNDCIHVGTHACAYLPVL